MTVRLRRALGAALALVTVVGVAAVAPASATPVRPRAIGATSTVHYAVNVPLCAQPKDPSANRCFAMERVAATRSTPHAYRYTVPNTLVSGPAGGATPDDIATAYGVNPATARSNQTVGIVDWYDDPKALADLNVFDTHYGLPKETATSFRKVNQKGRTTPLPKPDMESAGEIALDIESVRGMCHTCKILLIEAVGPTDADLATAENLAVAMGATEISNSFGEPEQKVSSSVRAAYNHPGVVITASTGDDGWYAWDRANGSGRSADAPEYPSSDPNVVAVGGTILGFNSDSTRNEEDVWNENGAEDQYGVQGGPLGAGGGGCSTLYAAPAWQATYPGYSGAGCNGKRLAADVSADADPASGLDVYLTYSTKPGWATIGGTSLASPLVAAMYALAGGSHGAAYPAATLYANASAHPTSVYDVIAGGNGFCAGDTTFNCGTITSSKFGTYNPNTILPHNLLDCSFPASGTPANAPALSSQCNAVTGYDGPSGLGTPNSIALFAQTNPTITLTHTALFTLKKSLTFTATAKAVNGITPVKYVWSWGDGTSTSATTGTAHHTYTKAGVHVITLTETDSRHGLVVKKLTTSVGRKPSVHYTIPTAVKAKAKHTFSASGVALNTGAAIKKISWKFGDGHPASGAKISHAYAHKGTYSLTLTVTDTSGVSTVVTRKVKVSA